MEIGCDFMKTFKLKSLNVLDKKDDDIIQHEIPLIDGLIINREDDENQWIIEAYTDHSYVEYFTALKNEQYGIMLQVKISKESNDPAFFSTKIIGINEIGQHMNVLFKGTIIDQRKNEFEEVVKTLIEKGYYGERLLLKFKELMKED